MDQFQRCGLVDSVSVGPVDTNLEGFLDHGDHGDQGRRDERLRKRERNQRSNYCQSFQTNVAIKTDCI